MKKIIFLLFVSCLYSSVFANTSRSMKVFECSADNQDLVEGYLNIDTTDQQKPMINYTIKITGSNIYYGTQDHEADCVKRFAQSNVYIIKGLYHPVNRNVLVSAPNCPTAKFSLIGDELEIKYNRTKPDGSGRAEHYLTANYKGCYAIRNYDNESEETLD